MRIAIAFPLTALFLIVNAGCSSPEPAATKGQEQTMAEKAGSLMYKASKEAKKGAEAAGRDLSKTTAELKRGYKDAKRADGK
jgi:hypothetical protein